MRLADLDHFTAEAREMGFVVPQIDFQTADELTAERMRDDRHRLESTASADRG